MLLISHIFKDIIYIKKTTLLCVNVKHAPVYDLPVVHTFCDTHIDIRYTQNLGAIFVVYSKSRFSDAGIGRIGTCVVLS
mgnify:FL=1